MPRSNIKCEHLRIDFRRANRFVAHQALQNLQWYAGIQHMHRVGVAERMRGDRHRECHPVDGGRFNRFANPGPYCPVGDVPDAGFLCSAGTLV